MSAADKYFEQYGVKKLKYGNLSKEELAEIKKQQRENTGKRQEEFDDAISSYLTTGINPFGSWDMPGVSILEYAERKGYFERHPEMKKYLG